MIALPPSLAGAFQVTAAWPFPGVAATPPGAPGAPAGSTGVTAADGAESAPVPTALIAATVNVYAVPFARPATVAAVAADAVTTEACAAGPM